MPQKIINIDQTPHYAKYLSSFHATSLKGARIEDQPNLILDKTHYPRFGSRSPRTRFYILKKLIKLKKVIYLITCQGIPIIYQDTYGQWHSLKETRSKLATKHIEYYKNELDISDTNIEEMADVFVSSIDLNDEKEYEIQIETAINLAILEYQEDQILEF